jgi:heme-degrading monooxygenase HmoA
VIRAPERLGVDTLRSFVVARLVPPHEHAPILAGTRVDSAPVQPGRIRHTVSFRLRHPAESDAERDFLHAAGNLSGIPGVQAFEILAEVSPKNQFRFGISMEFEDADAYEAYNQHPDHVRFVEGRWLKEVEDFLEIDYAALPY